MEDIMRIVKSIEESKEQKGGFLIKEHQLLVY